MLLTLARLGYAQNEFNNVQDIVDDAARDSSSLEALTSNLSQRNSELNDTYTTSFRAILTEIYEHTQNSWDKMAESFGQEAEEAVVNRDQFLADLHELTQGNYYFDVAAAVIDYNKGSVQVPIYFASDKDPQNRRLFNHVIITLRNNKTHIEYSSPDFSELESPMKTMQRTQDVLKVLSADKTGSVLGKYWKVLIRASASFGSGFLGASLAGLGDPSMGGNPYIPHLVGLFTASISYYFQACADAYELDYLGNEKPFFIMRWYRKLSKAFPSVFGKKQTEEVEQSMGEMPYLGTVDVNPKDQTTQEINKVLNNPPWITNYLQKTSKNVLMLMGYVMVIRSIPNLFNLLSGNFDVFVNNLVNSNFMQDPHYGFVLPIVSAAILAAIGEGNLYGIKAEVVEDFKKAVNQKIGLVSTDKIMKKNRRLITIGELCSLFFSVTGTSATVALALAAGANSASAAQIVGGLNLDPATVQFAQQYGYTVAITFFMSGVLLEMSRGTVFAQMRRYMTNGVKSVRNVANGAVSTVYRFCKQALFPKDPYPLSNESPAAAAVNPNEEVKSVTRDPEELDSNLQ